MHTKTLTKTALLTAVALVVFTIEAQLPPPVAMPGVKLGLSNIFVVYALYALGAKHALLLLLGKVCLGSLLAGRGVGFFYSLAGGLLCLAVMVLMKGALARQQMWVCSAIGAVAHNAGQLAVAVALSGTWRALAYGPVLVVSGILTGVFTGLAAQLVHSRLHKN